MNLQVNAPYTKCPYRCPYCVAGVTSEYPFADTLYKESLSDYLVNLMQAILKYDIKTVVLTGSTEPTLFPNWLNAVCYVLRGHGGLNVELQTKNYNWTNTYDVINTIAYSNDCIPTRLRPHHDFTVRDTFLWNKSLIAEDIIQYFLSQPNVDQCTVKQLVKSSYRVQSIDEHIEKIYKPLTTIDIVKLEHYGIWVDKDCSASENRYLIYRTDGKLYQKWSDMQPIG